ncbi:MAG TPA: hypothetical protein PK443_00885 [bacterium]|nr:hypothetical protein [bacterium]
MLSKSFKLIVSFGLFLSATLSAQAIDAYFTPQVISSSSLKYTVHTVEHSIEGLSFEIEVYIYGDGTVNIFPPKQITTNNTRITIKDCRYNRDQTVTCDYTKEELVKVTEELNPFFFDGSIVLYVNNGTKEIYKETGTKSFTTNRVN